MQKHRGYLIWNERVFVGRASGLSHVVKRFASSRDKINLRNVSLDRALRPSEKRKNTSKEKVYRNPRSRAHVAHSADSAAAVVVSAAMYM